MVYIFKNIFWKYLALPIIWYFISDNTFLAAFKAFLCGISKCLFVGYVGRFIVGVGSTLVYSHQMNLFPLKDYTIISGLFLFVTGCGALLTQATLAILAIVYMQSQNTNNSERKWFISFI